jgi:hypothetical protein
LKYGSTSDPGKDVDVNKCVEGCAALFPKESYFAGVRWDAKGDICKYVAAGSHDIKWKFNQPTHPYHLQTIRVLRECPWV